MPRRPNLALVLVLLPSLALAAPWQVVATGGERQARARVSNADGATLEIFRAGDDAVMAAFHAPHPSALAPPCPSLQVDEERPPFTFGAGETCQLAENRAELVLARLSSERLVSPLLYLLMNGTQVALRYRTSDRNYHETRFALSRSKRALRRVLGRKLEVLPGAAQ